VCAVVCFPHFLPPFWRSLLSDSSLGAGLKKGYTEILAFQDEDIPRLKNSLHLSELGMALESFSLIIPKAANNDELDSHRENLKKRMAEIEKQIQLLSDIQDQIFEKSGEYNAIREHIISVNNIRSDLEDNLNNLLEITRNMIELEDKRKAVFSHISKYKDSVRKKFRKRLMPPTPGCSYISRKYGISARRRREAIRWKA